MPIAGAGFPGHGQGAVLEVKENMAQNNINGWNDYSRNQQGQYPSGRAGAAGGQKESLSTYIAKTYLWMFAGLLLTFVIGYTAAASGMAERMLLSDARMILIGLTIAELACVIIMSLLIQKISAAVAAVFFFAYAALTGLTFSIYFVVFEVQTVMLVFGITALFFGIMAASALIFKLQLDRIRPFLIGGLFVLIGFGILSFFLHFEQLDIIISYIGIVVFLGFTAYDTTKIRANYEHLNGNGEMLAKASIISALELYLDFINLFLYILRIVGRNRS